MIRNQAKVEKFQKLLDRLINLATEDYYNPYKEFEWPDHMPNDQLWMCPDLMTIHGTPLADELNPAQVIELSKWESINFYSLNVHGIKELLTEVIRRIHSSGFEQPSDFFHHFVGEENEHMWFFAEFCLRYGGKIYADKRIAFDEYAEADIQSFLVFARILIFEEIVDYFNLRMGRDDSLHPTIQKINHIHHQDESRHIAFGRQVVSLLHSDLRETYGKERLQELGHYLERYMEASIQLLYNPQVYKDAGFEEPYDMRQYLARHPARQLTHGAILHRTRSFFVKNEIVTERSLAA